MYRQPSQFRPAPTRLFPVCHITDDALPDLTEDEHMRLIVCCKSCSHRAESEIATQVAQHGSGMPVIDWARLLRCTECGAREADFVVTGERR